MSKAKQSKVMRANAKEYEPAMPVLTAKGRRTAFTDKTAKDAVRAVKARAKRQPVGIGGLR